MIHDHIVKAMKNMNKVFILLPIFVSYNVVLKRSSIQVVALFY